MSHFMRAAIMLFLAGLIVASGKPQAEPPMPRRSHW